MKTKFRNFIREHFTDRPYKGAILLITIIFLMNPLIRTGWLATHCDYINLKDNPKINWGIESGVQSWTTDPKSHEDDTPQSSYALFSEVRYFFTSITTWYELGIPMVDIYRLAFLKPLAHHGLICDLGFEDNLAVRAGSVTSDLFKTIFWVYILICLYMNIKAYHLYRRGQQLFSYRKYDEEKAYQRYYEPLTLDDYLEWTIHALIFGIILQLAFLFATWATNSLFVF